MKTVVIGGSGFIGSHLCDRLCADPEVELVVNVDVKPPPFATDSPKYVYTQGQVTDRECLTAAMSEAEEVYNMASLLGTAELFNRMVEAVRTNVLGGVIVLDTAKELGIPRVCWPTKAERWPNMYTASKCAMHLFVKLYQGQCGLRVCVLEPWNLYGPKQTLWPVRKFFPTLAAQAILNRPATIYGDGTHAARVCHVETATRIAIAATRRNDDSFGYGEATLQICGPAMSLNDIARDLYAAAGHAPDFQYLPMRAGQAPEGLPEPPLGALDTPERLGIPFIEWDEGHKAVVEWYRETYTDEQLEAALSKQDEANK